MKKSLLFLLLASIATAAPKKPPKPFHDPPDQLFRMAPMPQSSRSVVVPLQPNLHLAFDTVYCRVHTVWKGGPMKLFGPCYHGGKRPFICHPNGDHLWGSPPELPWKYVGPRFLFFGGKERETTSRFLGFSTKGRGVTFNYELIDKKGNKSAISENVQAVGNVIIRNISIAPRKTELKFTVHSERGKVILNEFGFPTGWEAGPNLIQRNNDVLVFKHPGFTAKQIRRDMKSFNEEIFTEEGSTKGNPVKAVNEQFEQVFVVFKPSKNPINFTVTTTTVPDAGVAKKIFETSREAPVIRREQKVVLSANPKARRSFVLSPYYLTEAFALPEKMNLMVTGMDWLAKGKLAVCTYAGEVWIVEGATGPVGEMKYRRFARGMNEPMGVLVKDGKIHLGNKAEITRLSDTDKDGVADLFECVNRDWDYTGSYNSFSYGPVLDRKGNFVVANAGHAGRWSARNMGWALRIKPGFAKAEAFASGFREPNGIGTFGPDKDIFVTDNQGAWIGACKLNHVKDGGFYGHPASKPAPEKLYAGRKTFTPPAVWFPYKLARSSSGMCEITDDRFGPFKGQLLVGDFQNAIVTRVQLEKVGGEWQGAVWPFLKGFQSGVNRLVMGPDGHLYVGGCKTVAWAANAPFSQGLERVRFSGKIPFEVKTVRALPDGFELTFTKPADPKAAGDAAGYDVWQYQYMYHEKYGSPEFDHNGKPDSFTVIDVKEAKVSKDGLMVRLRLDGWKAGYVTAVRGLDARSATGEKLWHNTFYYTLNRIPK